MTSPAPQSGQAAVPVCYRHRGRETHLSCTRCGRPICPDCMIPASVGHQCPDCVAEGRRTQRPALTHFGGSQIGMHGYVTKALIGLNVGVFVILAALYGMGTLTRGSTPVHEWGAALGLTVTKAQGGYYEGALPQFGEVLTGIHDGGYYRLLTAMFLHYGVIHLALNMWALWVLGRSLEAALGPVRFGALYLICGFGGNVACALLSPYAFSAGASTAIYGLFAAYFFVLRRLGRDAMSVLPIIAINVVLSFSIPGISWQGHLGGLVTGAVCGLGLAYAPRENRNFVQAVVLAGVFAVLVALAVFVPPIAQ
ncbi:rhomboid family intramembrane serine protease [Catellatospora sp. KI3]|uniref:rhomboid family intramembrane serine protease n=1 Tax=Catellatospora sp. KI3 TaxID=3041620 RepID=UPI002482E801|nr:rhomboid family intramembrane serine protease [Catellatospora sp. KI3]MDI1464254.1 rhomboid family intramembrane serine protease [Catellatospora sp. KI3]